MGKNDLKVRCRLQIVVDIPEEEYKRLTYIDVFKLRRYVENGTPLPKGHGDLKDINKLKHAFIMWSTVVQENFTNADIANIIYNSPTIIEADKEDKNGSR